MASAGAVSTGCQAEREREEAECFLLVEKLEHEDLCSRKREQQHHPRDPAQNRKTPERPPEPERQPRPEHRDAASLVEHEKVRHERRGGNDEPDSPDRACRLGRGRDDYRCGEDEQRDDEHDLRSCGGSALKRQRERRAAQNTRQDHRESDYDCLPRRVVASEHEPDRDQERQLDEGSESLAAVEELVSPAAVALRLGGTPVLDRRSADSEVSKPDGNTDRERQESQLSVVRDTEASRHERVRDERQGDADEGVHAGPECAADRPLLDLRCGEARALGRRRVAHVHHQDAERPFAWNTMRFAQ